MQLQLPLSGLRGTSVAALFLTGRQLRFIFEYLTHQNASAAAVRVGYSERSPRGASA
ncbi:MAG TPA: terminase small subunit [Burkholderiales bacterium]|jgi:hypothetical protein